MHRALSRQLRPRQKSYFSERAVRAPGGSREFVTAAGMSSCTKVSVAANLNIYSSSSVVNSIPPNKGSDCPTVLNKDNSKPGCVLLQEHLSLTNTQGSKRNRACRNVCMSHSPKMKQKRGKKKYSLNNSSRADERLKPPGDCDDAVEVEQKHQSDATKSKVQLQLEVLPPQPPHHVTIPSSGTSRNTPQKISLYVPLESRQGVTVGLQQMSRVACRIHRALERTASFPNCSPTSGKR